jgi:hypothetical protein
MHSKSHPANLIFWTKYGEIHEWWSSSIRNFLQPSVTSLLFGTNTFCSSSSSCYYNYNYYYYYCQWCCCCYYHDMTAQFLAHTPLFSFPRLHSLAPVVPHPVVRSSFLAPLVTASTHLSFNFCTGCTYVYITLYSKYLSQHLILLTFSAYIIALILETKFLTHIKDAQRSWYVK